MGDVFGIPYTMGIILTKTIKYSFLGGFITIDLVRDSWL